VKRWTTYGTEGEKAVEIPLSHSNPIFTADSIYNHLSGLKSTGAKKIAIDTSTFTHEALLMIYRIIPLVCDGDTSIVYLYTGSKEYSVGDSIEDKWLSRGIREVRSVVGYPGQLLPSRSIHLILLAGFEADRALSLIREFEPSHVSLGCGDREVSFTEPHQLTNEQVTAAIRRAQSIAGEVDAFTFNPYSPIETCSAISKQCEKHGKMNTVIAPLNTKLSALGAAELAFQSQEVQVCYAQPLLYNTENYSAPREDVWGWETRVTKPI